MLRLANQSGLANHKFSYFQMLLKNNSNLEEKD